MKTALALSGIVTALFIKKSARATADFFNARDALAHQFGNYTD